MNYDTQVRRGAALAAAVLLAVGPSAAAVGAPQQIDHIRIVTDLPSLPSEYWHEQLRSPTNPLIEELLPPTSSMVAKLRIALARLPAMLHGSISSLSIGRYEAGDVVGDTYGNNIILNVTTMGNQALLNETLAHEATHCFQALIESTRHTDTSNVSAEATDAAKRAETPIRSASIGRIFRRLQSTSTIAHPGYPPYAGESWSSRYPLEGGGPAAAISDGFVTPYASNDARDDLAEIVAQAIDPGFAGHGYCAQFEGFDGEVAPHMALAFAKLNFVRALGLIDETRYKECVRNADPVDARLISMGSREFAGELGHGTQTVRHEDLDDDWLMWRIQGIASDARIEIRLRMRKANAAPIGSAIGFYELDDAGSHGMAADALIPIAAQNVITFQRTDTDNDTEQMAYTRISGGGYVLITDFSEDMVKGYAFDVPFYSIADIDVPPTDTMDVIWFLWER